MSGAAVEPLRLDEQGAVLQRRLGAGEVADRQVQPVLQEQALQLGGGGGDQLQVHGLVALAETADRPGELRQDFHVQPLGQADAHLAQQLVRHAARLVAEALDGDEQPPRRLQQVFALGRQAEAALAALAQAVAQARLQLGHLDADAGLAQAQFALRGAEAAALHHGDEEPQQLQVEVAQLAEHGRLHTLLR